MNRTSSLLQNRCLNTTAVLLWITDYIEVPNGTYVDKTGRVKMSYLVRTPHGERYAAPKYDL